VHLDCIRRVLAVSELGYPTACDCLDRQFLLSNTSTNSTSTSVIPFVREFARPFFLSTVGGHLTGAHGI
jgi:hypothetical protein